MAVCAILWHALLGAVVIAERWSTAAPSLHATLDTDEGSLLQVPRAGVGPLGATEPAEIGPLNSEAEPDASEALGASSGWGVSGVVPDAGSGSPGVSSAVPAVGGSVAAPQTKVLDAAAAKIAAAVTSGGDTTTRAREVPDGAAVLDAAAKAVQKIADGAANGALDSEESTRAASQEIRRLIKEATSAADGAVAQAGYDVKDNTSIGASDGGGSADVADTFYDRMERFISELSSGSLPTTSATRTAGDLASQSSDRGVEIWTPPTSLSWGDRVDASKAIQSKWPSMAPWIERERNLTQLAQIEYLNMNKSSKSLALAQRAYNVTLALRKRRLLEYWLTLTQLARTQHNLTAAKQEEAAATQRMEATCSSSDAAAARIEQFQLAFNASEVLYAKLAAKVNAEALMLNTSLARYKELKANTSDVHASAIDTVRASAEFQLSLQKEIDELNRLNGALAAQEDQLLTASADNASALEALGENKKMLDDVHAQAAVVARATDNLTQSRAEEQSALAAAGEAAAKDAVASQQARAYRSRFADDWAKLVGFQQRRNASKTKLAQALAGVTSAKVACAQAKAYGEHARSFAAGLAGLAANASNRTAEALLLFRSANVSVEHARIMMLHWERSVASTNTRMQSLRAELQTVEAALAKLDDTAVGAPSAAPVAETRAARAATSTEVSSPAVAATSARRIDDSETWQANGNAVLLRPGRVHVRKPGAALPTLAIILALCCLLAMVVVGCAAKPAHSK